MRWPSRSPMLSLLSPHREPPGSLIDTTPHEHAPGAVVYRYGVPGGNLLVTVWKEVVHEVIHQTPCHFEEDSAARNRELFAHYGEGQQWVEILDNGFGKTYRRQDQERYALWSYTMDIVTFGTMAFHEVKWG